MIDRTGVDHLVLAAADLSSALIQVFGAGTYVRSERAVGGGSINDTREVRLGDGRSVFVKVNDRRHTGLFLEEARGLLALAQAEGPRVPQPLALFEDSARQYLLLEYVASGSPDHSFWDRFGQALAGMHRTNRAPRPGFYADNHIGSTPQENAWMTSWHEFFAERRLRRQMELARRHDRADTAMEQALERLIARLSELIPDLDEGGASALHGDLWGGNFMVSASGEPVLIDPAVYYGHREADLAMTQLFGGFSERFYQAYTATWPLVPGFADRRDLYNLYHLLNHLNLFGTGYLGGCRAILRRFS